MHDPATPAILPFESPRTRARVALVALGACALLDVASATMALRYVDLLKPLVDRAATQEEGDALDVLDRMQLPFVITANSVLLVSVVAWCFWTYRCHRNLPALGAENLYFTPKSAIGFYFLPIFNVFRPYQAMREIHWGSDPRAQSSIDCEFVRVRTSLLLVAWWVMFILSNMANRVANEAQSSSSEFNDVDVYVAANYGQAIASGLQAFAAFLAAWVVYRITRRQDRRAAKLVTPALISESVATRDL